jgi:membrane protease YdiL (CAAX protease family)
MPESSSLTRFFTFTFILSWGAWIPAALTGQLSTEFPTVLLFVLGGFGPSVAGIWLTYRNSDRSTRRDLWQRLLDVKRISVGWYVTIAALFPLVFGAAYGINASIGGMSPGVDGLRQVTAQPIVLVGLLIMGIIGGPLAEELGWRGVALDRLQARWPTWRSNLILSTIWGVWHLPLFFIKGTAQHNLGLGTAQFWLFFINIVPLTFLITRVYNANGRSLLSAVLVHFFFNFTFGLVFPITVAYNVVQVVLTVAVVGILLVITPAPDQAALGS